MRRLLSVLVVVAGVLDLASLPPAVGAEGSILQHPDGLPRTALASASLRQGRSQGTPGAVTGARLRAASAAERELARGRLSLVERGGGADVTDLEAIQVAYSDPTDGNVVLLLWTETTSNNPAGVDVYLDEQLLGTMEGLPDTDLPGTNGVFITALSPGVASFRVSGGGTTATTSQLVVSPQPFADPENVTCRTDGRDPDNGTCNMLIQWSCDGVEPSSFAILVNGAFQSEARGMSREFLLTGVPAGSYATTVIGFLYTAEGSYRGSFVETSCDIQCPDLPCDPPFGLMLWQYAYDSGEANVVGAAWENGETPYATGIRGFVDGAALDSLLPGDGTAAFFGQLSPGQHSIGVQGDCGDGGVSETRSGSFLALSQTPHTLPIDGEVACTFTPAEGANPSSTTATWTNADPSLWIDVYVGDSEGALAYVGTIGGASTTVTLVDTSSTDGIMLQFLVMIDGYWYGSELKGCSMEPPPKQYIQGVCDGRGKTPTISSAIFGLGFLFLGSDPPPCEKACDSNGDSRVDLSDMVYILSFLFLGGPAFPDWTSATAPVCSSAPEEDCAVPNEACPL